MSGAAPDQCRIMSHMLGKCIRDERVSKLFVSARMVQAKVLKTSFSVPTMSPILLAISINIFIVDTAGHSDQHQGVLSSAALII